MGRTLTSHWSAIKKLGFIGKFIICSHFKRVDMALLPPQNEVCEGNVFTGVCLSIGVYPSMHWAGGFIPACTGQGCVYPSMHWAEWGVSQHTLGRGCLPRGCLPRGCLPRGVSSWEVSASSPGVVSATPSQTPRGGRHNPRTRGRHPPRRTRGRHPRDQRQTPPYGTRGRHPPVRYYRIRSTSGRYASYWNAFLLSSCGKTSDR